ncbi:tctex1 domain-containing protein 1-like [Nylanderia fulva]|uniref:tctex1 domain-containing protein 1-like n=1 Tax=Nylanderia fulva TaxID=613905 RepID=UPI0010FB5638|nr:tctex1 domain-containing protein 1-like [Nylanderia fulva]
MSMSMAQRPTMKGWSIIGKTLQARAYLSTVSLLAGLYKGSLSFRTGKGGFKIPRYQNTYRLQPYKPFKCETVDLILIDVMRNYLTGLKYEPQVCTRICQKMSAEVRDRIYRKYYDRFKVVIIMTIVQKLGQDVHVGFGKLWDVQKDTYSTHVIETPDFAAMGLVVGTYYE